MSQITELSQPQQQSKILEPWEIEWQRCKPWIEKAVKHQDMYSIEDVEEQIRKGIFALWPGKNSAIITEIVVFPQIKTLNILFCGGDYSELQSIVDTSIEQFAKQLGIKRLYGGGRKGWLRKLKGKGWISENLISKEL